MLKYLKTQKPVFYNTKITINLFYILIYLHIKKIFFKPQFKFFCLFHIYLITNEYDEFNSISLGWSKFKF